MNDRDLDATAKAGETAADIPADFDETAYLTAFPKIGDNIRVGIIKSALDHYIRKGKAEKRLEQPRYRKILAEQQLLARLANPIPASEAAEDASSQRRGFLANGIDTLLVSQSGIGMVIGWVDDRGLKLSAVSLLLADGRTVPSVTIARCRRIDAETSIGCPPGTLLGFFALIELGPDDLPGPGSMVQLHCGTGDPVSHPARPHLVTPDMLRESAFEYLGAAAFFGSHAVELFLQLDQGIGDKLLALNHALSTGITRRAYVERHGRHDRRFRASIVVCLFGRTEYLFLQAAAFSAARDAQEYEYVYVSNSPELTESIQREARIAAKLYGLSYTLVFLPGNAGFGAANNVAIANAACDRVLIANPDVFPRTLDWPRRHTDIVSGLPPEQTRLFGAPLFYDDGSLMHGGMFVASDTGLSVRPDGIIRQELLRVEHYGKGAPPDSELYHRSRRVTAVTGAFISADRAWFEKLGGFSEDYVFGHYEDADLGMKTWQAGGEVWVHDLPLWHMEGKGSVRRASHEGGSMINRWHFTRTWLDAVQSGLGGPDPIGIAA